MNSLVSVIIPVYKVEKYIEKCMQSLLDQTYTNFEALIVDDGSPDDSIKLAKALVGDDPRFVFFEKENGGQGTARNLALDHAKGEYVAFLDSDDTYTPDMLYLTVYELNKDLNIDVISFGINYVDEAGELIRSFYKEKFIGDTNNDVLLLNKTFTNFFWDKVFRKKVIENFRFFELIKTFEDVDLLYQILFGQTIKNIPNCLYNYTQRIGSTMYRLDPSFIQDKKYIVSNAGRFLKSHKIFDENKNYYVCYYLIEMFYKTLLRLVRYSREYNKDVDSLLSIADMDILSLKNIYISRHGLTSKEILVLMLFKANKYFFYMVIRVFVFFEKGNKL